MGDTRFRAFISYSHADEEWGAWLQRSLERFRAPKDLARLISAQGRPVRLAPVFRDREDLPVAGNLNEAIQKALADSAFQIVLCSPNAAKSRWVNEEIKLFNRLHGPGRTFAIIIAGEPGGGDDECFPPALRFKLDAEGEPTAEPAEPLAADAREEGDGKRYALLKTAAGMLGVGLDDLVRREAKARAQRTRAIVAGTSVIAASMTFAAVFAINQRNEARIMRGKAETLVEFMLSDLSERLEPVGRLDILEEVGGEVLEYYEDQDLKSLDAGALSRRARALIKLGQVHQRRGDPDAALNAYEAAFAATEEQLRRAPNDPERLFDHAQSVFYIGDIASIKGNFEAGEARMHEYLALAESMVALDANNSKYRLELAYATSNLGASLYNQGLFNQSIPHFKRSVEARRQLYETDPDDRRITLAYAYALSWLGFAELLVGRIQNAEASIVRQIDLYRTLGDSFEDDYQVMEPLIIALRRLATVQLAQGRIEEAERTIAKGCAFAAKLVGRDRSNRIAVINASALERLASHVAGLKGDRASERAAAERAFALAQIPTAGDPNGEGAGLIVLALARQLEAFDLKDERLRGELQKKMSMLVAVDPLPDIDAFAAGSLTLARAALATGDSNGAARIATASAERIRAQPGDIAANAKLTLAQLDYIGGDITAFHRGVEELTALGYAHPDLLEIKSRLAASEQ